jgi:integrator complex subunit 9
MLALVSSCHVDVPFLKPLTLSLRPTFMQLPEGLKSRCSVNKRPWLALYYTNGKTIELPNLREDFEVHLVHNVALGLQARQLNETTSVARLRKNLLLSSWLLQRSNRRSKRHLLHWDAVDLEFWIACCQHYKKREWCAHLLQMITV